MNENKMFEMMLSGKNQLQQIVTCNEYTKKFGLSLSEEDALILANDRKDTLQAQQRFEFGDSILPKLIFAFCDSAYVNQDQYVDILGKLQDIFYLYKNESLDELSDDELIDYMKEAFEGRCQGSLDFLEETVLEEFARDIRSSSHQFMGRYEEDDE